MCDPGRLLLWSLAIQEPPTMTMETVQPLQITLSGHLNSRPGVSRPPLNFSWSWYSVLALSYPTFLVFDWFGKVANSVYVIRLWHHHCHHHCPTSSSLLSVYNDSGYNIDGRMLYMACILAYFSHKCTSSNLGICHIFWIWGAYFCWYIFCSSMVNKCCSVLILMDGCSTVQSVCRLL